MNSIASCPAADQTNDDDEQLRELLKRCPPATYAAARAFRASGHPAHLAPLVNGIIARFADPDLRVQLRAPASDLRLAEDLGLDSLTLLEIVLLIEETLRISIDAEELRDLRTIGEVHQFIVWKTQGDSAAIAAARVVA